MTGSLTRRTPKRSSTPSRTSRARVSSSTVEAPPRLVRASVCLVDRLTRSPAAALTWPLAKPACSISHAALDLTAPSGCSQRGAPAGSRAAWSGARRGLVKKDPALQVSWSAGSRTMPLPRRRPSTAVADLRERGPLPRRHAEGAGELGVLHGRAEVAQPQLEGHVEHDVAAGIGLEPAVAVGEAAVGGREGPLGAVDPVPGADAGDGLGDVLAVGPDVLDRGGPHRTGDPRQRLDAGPALLDGVGDEVVPSLAGRNGQARSAAGVGVHARAAGGDLDHPAVETGVGDHEVGAASEQQERGPGGVRLGDRVDHLGLARGAHPLAGGPTQAQGGVVAQVRHGRRSPARRPSACRAPSAPRR